MAFHSILFDGRHQGAGVSDGGPPAFFSDLNLDQVVEAATAGRDGHDLEPFFWEPLRTVDGVAYRHEVFRDLRGTPLRGQIREFGVRMRSVREHLVQADKLRYPHQTERWYLEAARIYCDAVRRLGNDLSGADIRSRGFAGLRDHLARYTDGDRFRVLVADAESLRHDLDEVVYCVHISGPQVHVNRYEGQADYSAEIRRTFAKFAQGTVAERRTSFKEWPDMNHVEARILDLVARLFPDVFAALHRFYEGHRDFLNPTIARFDREVQFYVAYLDHLREFEAAGLSFCYPVVSDTSKAVSAAETFDLALAHRLIGERTPVVCNDFRLEGPERVVVVTGPNQGGKTTFARTFGQLHYLASLGCPVPGKTARLFLFDRLFTHFEKREDVVTLRGKLQDDLVRIRGVLSRATPRSVVILNEIFTSTTLDDARFLGRRILERILELDCLCVCVTFVDELASLADSVVSMASTVDPDDPAVRTYKVVRRPADGLAYAVAIAEKYGLTYERLRGRLAS